MNRDNAKLLLGLYALAALPLSVYHFGRVFTTSYMATAIALLAVWLFITVMAVEVQITV